MRFPTDRRYEPRRGGSICNELRTSRTHRGGQYDLPFTGMDLRNQVERWILVQSAFWLTIDTTALSAFRSISCEVLPNNAFPVGDRLRPETTI